jgi:hypothetical protein
VEIKGFQKLTDASCCLDMGLYIHNIKYHLGGWTILKWVLREIGWDGRDWIELAQDRDQWRALVNTVMNLRVP